MNLAKLLRILFNRFSAVAAYFFLTLILFVFRGKLLQSSVLRMDFDGLNTLKFRLVEKEEKKLYTLIRVELKREMYRFLLQEVLHQAI